MKKIQKTIEVFVSEHGQEFDNEGDCIKADKEDAKTLQRYFKINHHPDLTEGLGYSDILLVKVKIEAHRMNDALIKERVEDYCYSIFGKQVAFVQGVAPMKYWEVFPITINEFLDPRASPEIGIKRFDRLDLYAPTGRKLYPI